MDRPSIQLHNIGKRYRIGASGSSYRTLRESLMKAFSSPARLFRDQRDPAAASEIWALRGITLDVVPGEIVGVLGRNGAGKSTLLKILARITRPTEGSAQLRGRVGSMLDVGTGFHSELTGRENIHLNGAILGMSWTEVRRKMDRIIDFSGVKEFLDTPLKHYSNGMRVRLAFAITAQLETEILLADEVLAVGDAEFQGRCIDAMGSLARGGRTVIFVSHNMGAVGDLCTRAILLDKGRLVGSGPTNEIIKRYLSEFSPSAPDLPVAPPETHHGVAIRRISITDTSGTSTTHLDWRDRFSVSVEFEITRRMPAVSLGLTLVNQRGVRLVHTWIMFQQPFEPDTYVARGEFAGEWLSPGRYYIDLAAERYGVEYYHTVLQAAAFDIVKSTGEFGYDIEDYALLYSRMPWEVRPLEKPNGTTS